MSKLETNAATEQESSFTASTYGLVLSVFLTITAYLFTVHHMFSRDLLIGLIVLLALVQLLVQLVLFLGLGRETKPRWKLFVFCFMLMVVSILVGGSLWIMSNLNYHMTTQQINTYMRDQDSL